MGVTRQPVVQPHLQVHHGQGRLGRHGVQEVQRVRHEVAERHVADCTALVVTNCTDVKSQVTQLQFVTFHPLSH